MLVLLCLVSAEAADNPFRVQPQGLSVPAGTEARATFVITVPPGTFLYQDMTHVQVVSADPLVAGEPSLPPSIEKMDPVLGMVRGLWDADVYVEIPVTAPAQVGDLELSVEATYQGCKGSLCYMPVTEQFVVPVKVIEAPAEEPADAKAGT